MIQELGEFLVKKVVLKMFTTQLCICNGTLADLYLLYKINISLYVYFICIHHANLYSLQRLGKAAW